MALGQRICPKSIFVSIKNYEGIDRVDPIWDLPDVKKWAKAHYDLID